jgi:hypothetical protein
VAVFDLLDHSKPRAQGGAGGAGLGRADKLFNIDGIMFDPPPHTVIYKDKFRVTNRQSLAGQVGFKGGLGGCEIMVRGKVAWKQAAFLWDLRDLLIERSVDDSFMVWYDPVQQLSYEAICPDAEVEMNVTEAHMYHYGFTLKAQVMGYPWNMLPLATEGYGQPIDAFDMTSLDTVVNDAQNFTELWKKAQAQTSNSTAGQGGGQPPPPLQ